MAEPVYSREQVEQWQTKLEVIASEPRTTFTKRQVVEELIDTIETALESRSYLEVANGLKDWGLDISEGSLNQYVSRYRKANKTKPASLRNKLAMKTAVLEDDEKSVQAAVVADEPMKEKKAKGGKPKGSVEMPKKL